MTGRRESTHLHFSPVASGHSPASRRILEGDRVGSSNSQSSSGSSYSRTCVKNVFKCPHMRFLTSFLRFYIQKLQTLIDKSRSARDFYKGVLKEVIPYHIFGAAVVQFTFLVIETLDHKVSVGIMGRIVVCDHSAWDPQSARH